MTSLLRIAAALCPLLACALHAESLDLSRSSLECSGPARFVRDARGIALRMDDPKGQLRIQPAGGTWDLSERETLEVDVENRSATRSLRLDVRLRAGDKELVGGIALMPGEKRTMTLRLPHRPGPALPPEAKQPFTLDTAHIASVDFYLQWPFEWAADGLVDCLITDVRAEGKRPAEGREARAGGVLPFIDPYGQNLMGQWPQKIRSAADLPAARAAEQAQLDASTRPAAWDEFGGWKNGPQLEATGSFRTAKHQGRWYFVDPTGKLFFSQGIDVLKRSTDALNTAGRAAWFAAPVGEPSWQPIESNLRLKYGTDDFADAYYQTVDKRLEHWGINTIGSWGDKELMLLGRTPYTLMLGEVTDRAPKLGKLKFNDVFDPAFARVLAAIFTNERNQELLDRSRTDPYCIGYFIDNELAFGRFTDEIVKCPATQAAKVELVRWLRERRGTIEALNAAWGTSHASWDDLLPATAVPTGEGFKADAHDFNAVVVDRYFRLCRDAVKSVAPNRLYLGCRFLGHHASNRELAQACATYADVLSVNMYNHTPANFPLDGFPDIPVLISEFHFGIADRGMLSPGLAIAGTTTAERATAYTRFLQGALTHPLIVGTHWFQYRDQPLIGRWDGEGYQIGFVDVADTPYPELGSAARTVGERMYPYRLAGKGATAFPGQ